MSIVSPLSAVARALRRAAACNTGTIVSFSLTLLGGGIAVLAGLVPLPALTLAERTEIGAILFIAPVLTLTLALVSEASRMVLNGPGLPQPRRQQVVRWSPGYREG